jgi:hypothetical protein
VPGLRGINDARVSQCQVRQFARQLGRRIGNGDIISLREIVKTYRQLDNRLGGGQLRSAVVQLLDGQVTPLLRSATFNEATGLQLASVAAELSQMVGWMAFDTEAHGLAQRYLVQALGLARLAEDNALTAEILAAMSQQAVYVARADQAIDLARAASTMAIKASSPILLTECHVAEAHGHAARNDARSCSQALTAAEHSFATAITARIHPNGSPTLTKHIYQRELLTASATSVKASTQPNTRSARSARNSAHPARRRRTSNRNRTQSHRDRDESPVTAQRPLHSRPAKTPDERRRTTIHRAIHSADPSIGASAY